MTVWSVSSFVYWQITKMLLVGSSSNKSEEESWSNLDSIRF